MPDQLAAWYKSFGQLCVCQWNQKARKAELNRQQKVSPYEFAKQK